MNGPPGTPQTCCHNERRSLQSSVIHFVRTSRSATFCLELFCTGDRIQKIRSFSMKPFLFLLIFSFVAAVTSAGEVIEEIMAKVGNEIITKSDFEKESRRLYEELSRRFEGTDLEEKYATQRGNLLDMMINIRLMEQRAKEMNLNVDDEVTAAVQRLSEENEIPDDESLDQVLRREGSSLAQLREDFRKRLIQQRIMWNYLQGKVTITEDEIQKFYEEHEDEFLTPAATKIKRYEISSEEIDSGTLLSEAKSLVNALKNNQKLSPENFPHLTVHEPMEFLEPELDPKFAEALKNTPVGSFTDPLKVETGWIVLQVEERSDKEPIPFEEARGRIYNILLQQRAEKYQKSFLEDLRKQNYVEIVNTVS